MSVLRTKDEPKPFIHQKLDFVNGRASRRAVTVYCYVYTSRGRVSKRKVNMAHATKYAPVGYAKGVKSDMQLKAEAIELLKQSRPSLPDGLRWGPIRDYNLKP